MFFFILILVPSAGLASTIHVPGNYSTIQQAIVAAQNGDTILVASGTYFENINFLGKAITVTSQQGTASTVIDGNGLGSVVTFNSGEDVNSVLTGFTITNGESEKGGGINCNASSPSIIRNTITKNYAGYCGGGINCEGPNCATIIEANTISDNASYLDGGGICCMINSKPDLFNNFICANTATYCGGGIASAYGSVPILVNNTLFDNTAGEDGGGIYCDYASVQVKNTCISGNKAGHEGPELFLGPGGTVAMTYSNIKGGWPGENNIDVDPQFMNPTYHDLHLKWTSPCINMGSNDGAPANDADNDPRPCMGTVDIGADEFTGTHALGVDKFTISASTKGVANFPIYGGAGNASRSYIVLGSTSGSVPGSQMPGGSITLPVSWDIFTKIVITFLHTKMFTDFLGKLDPQGQAAATYNTMGPLPPATVGMTMSFAFALNAPWDFASNPVHVEIVP
jgi:predicted outer membrane repeat protein